MVQTGIPTSIHIVILVRRQAGHSNNFSGQVDIETETSGRSLMNGIARLARKNPIDDPLVFNPTLPPQTQGGEDSDNIDIMRLGTLNISEYAKVLSSGVGGIETGRGRSPLVQMDEGATKEQKLFYCARGLYSPAWYKFRRFETLSLLNLYHHQDKLVQIEKRIETNRGQMTADEVDELGKTLQEYCKLFMHPHTSISCYSNRCRQRGKAIQGSIPDGPATSDGTGNGCPSFG